MTKRAIGPIAADCSARRAACQAGRARRRPGRTFAAPAPSSHHVVKLLLWCILFVLCWPVAVAALLAYPVIWLLLIPFRIIGFAVDGVLGLIRGVVMLPARLLNGPRAA